MHVIYTYLSKVVIYVKFVLALCSKSNWETYIKNCTEIMNFLHLNEYLKKIVNIGYKMKVLSAY